MTPETEAVLRLRNGIELSSACRRELVQLIDNKDAEIARLRAGLEKIRGESKRYRQYHSGPSSEWSNGYLTALAHCSLIAFEYVDPTGWAENQKDWELGSTGTDREWFERTGNCGGCGRVAGYCDCDGQCGCGPHEPATEPLPCHWCRGAGIAIEVVR